MADANEIARARANNHRWPKALRIFMEHGKPVRGVEVLTLACSAAYCNHCTWKGPLRSERDEAEKDRARHLDDPGPVHLYLEAQR